MGLVGIAINGRFGFPPSAFKPAFNASSFMDAAVVPGRSQSYRSLECLKGH